jgi:hypothetical protein
MVLNKKKGKSMKRKALLFAITLILVVSLVPLAGVSAKQSPSASSTAAAATVQKKTIKTAGLLYCNSYPCFKYKQQIKWWYDGKRVTAYVATMKGVIYQYGWYYLGYYLWATSGGAGKRSYYRWTEGEFWSSTYGYYYIDVEQKVKRNGASWGNWWWY